MKYNDIFYITRLPSDRPFDWVEDVVHVIAREDLDALLGLLHREIETDNGDWRGYTEDLLDLLESLDEIMKRGMKKLNEN